MERKQKDNSTLHWIYLNTKGQRIRICCLIGSNILFSVLGILFALLCKNVIDGAVSGDLTVLVKNLVGLGIVVLGQLIIRLECNSIREYTKSKLSIYLREKLVTGILQKEYSNLSEFHSGELVNRVFSDVQVVSTAIVGIIPNISNAVTRLFMASGVLLALDGLFAGILLGSGIVLFLLVKVLRGRLKGLSKAVMAQEDKTHSLFQEILENVKVLKVFEADAVIRDKIIYQHSKLFKTEMRKRTVSIIANAGFNLIFQMGYLFALAWGTFGIYNHTLTYGTLTAMLQLVSQVQVPLSNLSGIMPQWYNMIASAERLIELEQLKTDSSTRQYVAADICDKDSMIIIDNVTFTYDREAILTQACASIKLGETTAIMGLSGGGKSTLMYLLMGLFEPQKGRVYLQNKDSQIGIRNIRELFSYVPQGNCLFSGTIRENLTLLNADTNENDIWKALEIACADGFVKTFGDGLDTYIGQDGLGLSEGQAQRIAIARAVLKKSPILLFDEATSALDEWTEKQLLINIEKLGKTCILITHRKAALSICSQKIVVKEGQIYETDC